MTLNPLNELKRRLEDDTTDLPKRLCLAKNVVQSQHFSAATKERIIAEWLNTLTIQNELLGQEFRSVLEWLTMGYDLSNELKVKLIQMTSQYLQRNPLQSDDIQHIIQFIDNDKISIQLNSQINEYLLIIVTLLQNLKSENTNDIHLCDKIFNNIIKYYKDCKRKLEFIVKFLDGENLETVFSFLDTNRSSVINVCQSILFPITKKSFFINFLQTLIVKDNIDDLIAEKGDNIQSVLKIMSTFFTFPKGRTQKDPEFLKNFIDVFVSAYRNESQIIFAFYIMVTNSLNMDQSYMIPAMRMPPIIFEENNDKIKRKLFLNMLEILLQNEVDVSVRLTDTFGEKISKVEIKKAFASFLQAVMMSQLKLQGKVDKITLKIIKVCLLLDPILIEQKMKEILPPLLTAKKNNTAISMYTETLSCLLEVLFKLSRGITFLNQILPSVKLNLEAANTEQFELIQTLKEPCDIDKTDKIKSKIIYGCDLFPHDTITLYGKLTSELMFRQNKELLLLMQKDLEEHCLMMLEEGFVSPSIITLTELLSAILSSVFDHNKMADHSVPAQIAAEFWKTFQSFEDECLTKFGQCLLKLSFNSRLTKAFMQLCLSVAHLKLFNIKYSHTKMNLKDWTESSELFDLSVILPCLSNENWLQLIKNISEDELVLILDKLLLTKFMFKQLISQNDDEDIKTHLIKKLTSKSELLNINYYTRVLFTNLDDAQYRQLSKNIVKLCISQASVLENDSIKENKTLLSHIVIDLTKNIAKNFNTECLAKNISKSNFDVSMFVKNNDIVKYFQDISLLCEENEVSSSLELLRQSKIYYLDEKYQLTAILVLLLLKKCCQSKNIRRVIDTILLNIFELSTKCPDIYKLFPVHFIFSFKDKILLDLLTLKIKTCNQNVVLKCILELAVKKVKIDSDIVKNIVTLIMKKKKSDSKADFSKDPVFQIGCLILPVIAKEKKAITTSAYRSILADLQEKLHKNMLESFKNIDFNNSSLFEQDTGSTVESSVTVMSAMSAFSLTLAKYCESTDNEIQNLECLWSGLAYFVDSAINAIQDSNSKNPNIESSLQLIIAVLRYNKKLETHALFENKDKLYLKIWRSLKLRLIFVYGQKNLKKTRIYENILENIQVVLKFVCELSSVDCYVNNFVGDLTDLCALKKPTQIVKEIQSTNTILPAHKTAKYLLTQCLKANIIGPKCVAMTKLILQSCKNLHLFIQQHYVDQCCQNMKTTKMVENDTEVDKMVELKIDDSICELLKIDTDTLCQAILSAKKITLDYKFLDAIFELQHLLHYIISGRKELVHVQITWESYFSLYESCTAVLNNMLNARKELLEDRWPNYMQCYRGLISSLCERASLNELDRLTEEKLGEIAHNIEKLTQAISKRKTHVSRIAAYTVADICYHLEKTVPPRNIRQHLENSVALLIQASDSSYAMAFLKRSLAGSPGQMTMTNMYSMYKRYHKYVGNA